MYASPGLNELSKLPVKLLQVSFVVICSSILCTVLEVYSEFTARESAFVCLQ